MNRPRSRQELRAMFARLGGRFVAQSRTVRFASGLRGARRMLGHPVAKAQAFYRRSSRRYPWATEAASLVPIIGAGTLAERALARSPLWRHATRRFGSEVLASAAVYAPIVLGVERVLHGPKQTRIGVTRRRRHHGISQ